MISSQILFGNGDYKIKRMKTLVEEFFFHSHSFSDLILVVQDKELYVDKSVLAAGSKIFHSYFQDENLDSIEILDVTSNEMIELLQFLYPQFHCTIHNQNITILLILANRFEIDFLLSACRKFILMYLSKLNTYQNDEIRLLTWYREFFFINDLVVCQTILNKLSQSKLISKDLFDFEDKIQWKIFQARAKYLEKQFNN